MPRPRDPTMLASRGCLYDCSFCSIRQFYAGAPGPLRRVRSPEDVAAEMKDLYQGRDVRLFLFQDDDFAAKSESSADGSNGYCAPLIATA